MSQVRMCDKCGEIFSEKREGWQTFSVTKTSVNPYGQPIQFSEEFDACPACAFNSTVQPVVKAIEDRPPSESVKPREPSYRLGCQPEDGRPVHPDCADPAASCGCGRL